MILRTIGLMSGTSMDGIDAVIIDTDGKYLTNSIAGLTIDYDQNFQMLLKSAEYSIKTSEGDLKKANKNYSKNLRIYLSYIYEENYINKIIENLSNYLYQDFNKKIKLQDIIKHSTILHANIVDQLLKENNLKAKDIDLIGYHGQAFYHKPNKKISLVLGDGQLLANLTKITVINDFRSNDVKNGGQGAPFAPLYHQALAIKSNYYPVAIVNCGGISNITLITGPSEEEVIGFDTGPGNVLIDQYIRIATLNEESMDKNGKYGLRGNVNYIVLQNLKDKALIIDNKNFLTSLPPKSLDSGDCKLIEELKDLSLEDACATLEFFTASTILESLKLVKTKPPLKWVLSGGGWKNPVITNKLKYLLTNFVDKNIEVNMADAIGWNSQFMEAEIFAYLAVRTLNKLPISTPQTTNVSHPCLGGHAYVPKKNKISSHTSKMLLNNPELLKGYC